MGQYISYLQTARKSMTQERSTVHFPWIWHTN